MDADRLVGDIATIRDEEQRIKDSIDEVKLKLIEYNDNQDRLAKKHPEKLALAHTQFYALKQRYTEIITDVHSH